MAYGINLQSVQEYAARGDWKNALAGLQHLIQLDPDNLALRIRLADLYVKAELKHRAIEVLESVLQLSRAQGQSNYVSVTEQKLATLDPAYAEKQQRGVILSLQDFTNLPLTVKAHHLPSNTAVLREGTLGRSLFTIQKGRVKVITHDEVGEEIPLATLGEGEFFGEGGLLTGQPRGATVVTTEPSEIVELGGIDLLWLGQQQPRVKRALNILYKQRFEALEGLKRKSLDERRTSPRVKVQLPIRWKLLVEDQTIANRVIAGTTRDLAKLGIGMTLSPSVLPLKPHQLPGLPILFGIALPEDYGTIKGVGRIEHYIWEGARGPAGALRPGGDMGRIDHHTPPVEAERAPEIHMGVTFLQMKEEGEKALTRFLASRIYRITR